MFNHGRSPPAFLLTAAFVTCAVALQSAAAVEPRSVEVEGTQFKVTLTDGHVLRSSELVGATLTVATSSGPLRLRIDTVERDPDAKNPPVWLHSFSTEAPDGSFHNLCEAGPDGRRQGFPLAFRPRPGGALEPAEPGSFELVCTGRARGKCVRFGYLPWTSDAMREVYNACVRVVRADYCGECEGTTRTGTLIDHYDAVDIEEPGHDPRFEFEAGWTASGAVCVRHVRIKENISLERLAASCPRLREHLGESCTEKTARALGATVFVRSLP